LFFDCAIKCRVQLSLTNTYYDSSIKSKAGYQIQANFSSHFSAEEIVQPTEDLLRTVLTQFGDICDIVVKDYIQHKVIIFLLVFS
jgi:hypothetical protein